MFDIGSGIKYARNKIDRKDARYRSTFTEFAVAPEEAWRVAPT